MTALLLLGLGAACSTEDAPSPLPQSGAGAASAHGPYLFRDVSAASGLAGFRQVAGSPEKPFIVETVGGGCALSDLDGDGDLDAYLTNGGWLGGAEDENPSDALYVNDGHAHFEDSSRAAGIDERRWTNGVSVCDVDGDGRSDLYLTNYGRNTLYVAAGPLAFVDRTEAAGVGDPSWSTGASFLDFDRDGDLDLFVANYVAFDEARLLAERPTTEYEGVEVMLGPRGLPGAPDRFFVNGGANTFREAGVELGLRDEHFGFQSLALDFDGDGWLDLFVGNDSVANNLWRNRGGAGFEDVALRQGVALNLAGRPQASMGVAAGDYDGDLDVDLYVTTFSNDYNTLFRAEGGGFFLDVTQTVGLVAPTMAELGWGTGFEDYDLDGDLELYAVNGHVYPQVDRFRIGTEYRQPAQLFEYEAGKFHTPAGLGGPDFVAKAAARGSSVGDVDGDGDLDLLIEDLDGPPRLLANEGRQGTRLGVELVGAGANRDAIGARVVVRSGGRAQLRLAGVGYGFLSSSPRELVFGLGNATVVEALEVTWPDGSVDRFADLAAGLRVRVLQGATGAEGRLEPIGP